MARDVHPYGFERFVARIRVIAWAASKYAPSLKQASEPMGTPPTVASAEEFSDFPSLFDAARPKTEPEKALVAAYWHQTAQGQADLDAQTLNSALKNMGHGIANITDALTSLMKKKPALILQVHKSGKVKQARKKYRVTTAGSKKVEKMISDSANGGEESEA